MKLRKIYCIIIIIGILGIIDTLIISLFYSGLNTGVILPGIIGIILISYSVYKIKTNKPLIKNKTIRIICIFTIIFFFLSFIIIEIIFVNSLFNTLDEDIEYMIILGAGLSRNGMSPALINRLNKGLEILTNYPNIKVIVSGGKGLHEKEIEAEIMKDFLIYHGVNHGNIIVEDKSSSTYENFIFSKKLIKPEIKKIFIVTSSFHTFRAKMIAKRTGIIPISIPAKDSNSVLINCYTS